MPDITKIVVTGGVCGGKTTALTSIRTAFTRLGYKVITVPEPATEFKTNGVLPWECASGEEYQRCQMTVQITREHCFERAARGMADEKILIVCDRGMLDNKYYMTDDEFQRVIAELGHTEMELRDSYDAVFHLVTAAKGAEAFYTNDNNAARHETLEEAAAMDDGFISAWAGHPHLRIIDNSTDFEGKMDRLIHEIAYVLGEDAPLPIVHKYLIEYPDVAWLESLPNCQRVDIDQFYLRSAPDREIRVRKIGAKGWNTFYLTEKQIVDTKSRLVRRQRLTLREYEYLVNQADPNRRVITKRRYCLAYEGQCFEIDVFPCWEDQAIAKIELTSEDTEVVFPPELHVIREVTNEDAYRNAVMASKPSGATH
ncbi:MAG: AAA family ATPase [Atopobiaceae bacterium]|nr:AAA family ATPase [Atopobiaceae bacterium]